MILGNGQVEMAKSVIEQYLRCYCSTTQNKWCIYLPLCEMAYNNSFHKFINMSPFCANYGFNPVCNIESPPVLLKITPLFLHGIGRSILMHLKGTLSKLKDISISLDPKIVSCPTFDINDMIS